MVKRLVKGFTLIELMIVVAVIAILASLAYYNYNRYAFRTRRADGREMLLRVAAAEERYFTNRNQYTVDIDVPATSGGLGFTSPDSEHGHYTVVAALTGGGSGYLLTATPNGGQATDVCGDLTLNDLGHKDQSGATDVNGSCW